MATERIYQLVGSRVIRVNYLNSSGYIQSEDLIMSIGDVQVGNVGQANAEIVKDEYSDNTWLLNLTIPRGQDGVNGRDGVDGRDGLTPTFTVGDCYVVDTDAYAKVTVNHSDSAVQENLWRLDFWLPRGIQGPKGDPGVDGSTPQLVNATTETTGIVKLYSQATAQTPTQTIKSVTTGGVKIVQECTNDSGLKLNNSFTNLKSWQTTAVTNGTNSTRDAQREVPLLLSDSTSLAVTPKSLKAVYDYFEKTKKYNGIFTHQVNLWYSKRKNSNNVTIIAPYTGLYKLILIGGGGAGSCSSFTEGGKNGIPLLFGGAGGGGGETLVCVVPLTKGNAYTFTIGAGGNASTKFLYFGGNGGNTFTTIDGVQLLAQGGFHGGTTHLCRKTNYGADANCAFNDSRFDGTMVELSYQMAMAGRGGGFMRPDTDDDDHYLNYNHLIFERHPGTSGGPGSCFIKPDFLCLRGKNNQREDTAENINLNDDCSHPKTLDDVHFINFGFVKNPNSPDPFLLTSGADYSFITNGFGGNSVFYPVQMGNETTGMIWDGSKNAKGFWGAGGGGGSATQFYFGAYGSNSRAVLSSNQNDGDDDEKPLALGYMEPILGWPVAPNGITWPKRLNLKGTSYTTYRAAFNALTSSQGKTYIQSVLTHVKACYANGTGRSLTTADEQKIEEYILKRYLRSWKICGEDRLGNAGLEGTVILQYDGRFGDYINGGCGSSPTGGVSYY